jgi:chitinase
MWTPIPANGGVSRMIVTYYQATSSQVKPHDIDGSKMTHLIYAFAAVDNATQPVTFKDPKTEVKPHDGKCEASGKLYEVYKLKEKYPNLQIILALGGFYGSRGFSSVSADDNARKKLVQDSTRVMLDYGLDGIDIDWEFPVLGTVSSPKKSWN